MSERFAVTQKAVLVGPEERVLLLENEDGVWELPGGQLYVGESPEQGLRRAVSEATGLDVDVGRPVLTTAWELDQAGAFATIYEATSVTEQATLADGYARAVWMAPTQAIERELNDTQRRAIERALGT
jgi:ADP-ribose pyrophosphatase YjhB (NUDIX family)